jgi:hypothetical protein
MGGMAKPTEQPLRIADPRGRIREVPMRWTASHQDGWALFFDDAVEPFKARSLFEALALYRATIEPEGWRLLHAAARADCWPDPRTDGTRVQQLTPGTERTSAIECFAPASRDEVTDLASQRTAFDAWMAGLKPVAVGRVRPRAGHEHDAPVVEFGPLAVAAGECLIDGKPKIDRLFARLRSARPSR